MHSHCNVPFLHDICPFLDEPTSGMDPYSCRFAMPHRPTYGPCLPGVLCCSCSLAPWALSLSCTLLASQSLFLLFFGLLESVCFLLAVHGLFLGDK